MYSNMVYQNQLSLKDAFNIGFSQGLNEYLDKLLNYNNANVCALYYANNADGLAGNLINNYLVKNILACQTVGNGLISGGLIQSEDALVRNTYAVLNEFYGTSNRDSTTQVTYINSQELEDASNYSPIN